MVDIQLPSTDRPFGPFATWRDRVLNAPWIVSFGFDAMLLVFAPLSTLPIMLGLYLKNPLLAAGGGVTLAFAHYWSTASFYFWDENRPYHRERWVAFFVGPVLLAATYVALLLFRVPYIVQLVLFAWNTWHVSRQNCGILSLYRTRAGVSAPDQKSAANNAIIAASAFLAVWNIKTHPDVAAVFAPLSAHWATYFKLATGAAAVFFVGRLLVALVRRKQELGIPEGVFLATSLVFFWPYLYIRDSAIATFAMLLPHYVQYLSLTWLLHRRKFGGKTAGAPFALRKLSSNLIWLVPVLFAIGALFYLIHATLLGGRNYYWFESAYLLIAFEHYYLDGLVWSFRQPHVRRTMLPFLTSKNPA